MGYINNISQICVYIYPLVNMQFATLEMAQSKT